MIKRKVLGDLLEWKKKGNRKPLLLRGARQVGKTTVIDVLGEHYKYYIKLNLERVEDASLFKLEQNVKTVFDSILLEKNISFDPENTLLFIDEVQEVPGVLNMLRYFYEDLPTLHVAAAGSLLEFAMGEVQSMPVGRIEQMAIHPLDFEEYLSALGEEQALKYYNEIPLQNVAYNKLLKLYNSYILIGGMPEVVSEYVKNHRSLSAIQDVYSSIWDNYLDDVEKYGKTDKIRSIIRHIVNTAPYIRDRITFHNFGNSSFRSNDVKIAFDALHKAGIIKLIYPTNDIKIPVSPNYRRKPKIQILDTGLLNYASKIQHELIKLSDLNNAYKGYIVNHMVLQEQIATKNNHRELPYFWTRENANANSEVDLVVQSENIVIPVEIKSGASGRLRSLMEFIDRSDLSYGIRLLANEMNVEEIKTINEKPFGLYNLPYFLGGKLKEYVQWIEGGEIVLT